MASSSKEAISKDPSSQPLLQSVTLTQISQIHKIPILSPPFQSSSNPSLVSPVIRSRFIFKSAALKTPQEDEKLTVVLKVLGRSPPVMESLHGSLKVQSPSTSH